MFFPTLVGVVLGLVGLTTMQWGLLGGACFAIVGTIGPSFWLDRMKASRQSNFRRALPDALDVMVICLEGGLSLPAALKRMAAELRTAHPILALELNIVQREIQLGRSAGEALRKMGERTDLEEVRSLASVILQAEKFGASLVKSLRVHSETISNQTDATSRRNGPDRRDQGPFSHGPVYLASHVHRNPRAGRHSRHGNLRQNGLLTMLMRKLNSEPDRVQVMGHRDQSPDVAALRSQWRQWVGIVELITKSRSSDRRVDARQYALLHKELIEKCRSLTGSTNEEEAFYRYLEDLAQPWLTPSVLARADHEILLHLLDRCRQAERHLGGRTWASMVKTWALPAGLAGLIVLCLIFVSFTIPHIGWPAVQRLRDFSDDLLIAIKRSTEVERLTFVGVVLMMVSIGVLSRGAKI